MSADTPHETVLLLGASRGLRLAIAAENLTHGSHVVATVRGSGPTGCTICRRPMRQRWRSKLWTSQSPSRSTLCTNACADAASICCS